MNEHKNNIRETPNEQNALTKHTIQKDHFFDFVNTKILANEPNYKKRLLLEMCHIAGTDDAVNFRIDVENLSKIYILSSESGGTNVFPDSNNYFRS